MSAVVTLAVLGAAFWFGGIGLFFYASRFAAPSAGASGAGMAGLHDAMLVFAAMALIVVGAGFVLIAFVMHMRRRRAARAAVPGEDGA